MKNKIFFNKQSSLKNKVLVVYTSSVVSPLAQPHGALIIANVLQGAGFDVRLVCPYWKTDNEQSLLDDIVDFSPDMIAISIRNHGTAGFDYRRTAERSFYSEIKKIVYICTKNSDAPIVLGGSGFSTDPQKYLNIKGVTAGFIGNSELDLKKFAHKLLNEEKGVEESLAGIASAVYSGKKCDAVLPSGIKLGDQNFVLCPEGIKAALAVGGTIPFRTKTGCNGRCIYCVVPLIEGRNFRSPENVVNEIRMAVDYNIGNRLFCADSEFGQDPCHDKKICQAIFDSGLSKKIKISGYADPYFMSEDMVERMKKAGWREISVSADCLSPAMRSTYRKRGSAIEVEAGIRNLLSAKIQVTVNILLGGPGETFDTIAETLTILKKWKNKVDICFTFGLTVFPGTPLEMVVKQRRYRKYFCEKNGDLLPSFCSPCSPAEMVKFLNQKDFSPARNSNIIFWNEETDIDNVKFYKEIMLMANGDIQIFPRPNNPLQQMMLEVATLIQKGGEKSERYKKNESANSRKGAQRNSEKSKNAS